MTQFNYQASYRRNLPHFQPPGATVFLTFRLSGSLPQCVVDQWLLEQKWLAHLEQTNPNHFLRVKADFDRIWFAKFESILAGASCGPLWLKEPRLADKVAESLHYRDGKVYRLDAFTIMPNHAHVVFKPLPTQAETQDGIRNYHSLAVIMQSLKGFTAHECNRLLEREGEFWAHESFDHSIRNDDEWRRIVSYVLNNPVKAAYVQQWQDWRWNYRRTGILAN